MSGWTLQRRTRTPGILRPNVLIVLPSTQRRGAEIEGVALAAELQSRGVDCVAVAVCPAPPDVGSLDVDALDGGHVDWRRNLAKLRRRCREADVVIAYGSVTLPACSIAMVGLEATLVYRSIGEPTAWVRGALHRRRTRLLFRRVDHVAALFPSAGRAITDLYGVPAAEVTTISNARDAGMIRPASEAERRAARVRLGLDPGSDIIVQIGALAPEKRVDAGLRVAAMLNSSQLVVVGDGPLRNELQRQASESGGNVRFLGALNDIIDVLHAADVLLLTSTTEGIPGVVIEAGLGGVPAVAADVGGVRQAVASPDSLFSSDASDSEIANKVRAVLDQRAERGIAAERHVRSQFTWEHVGAAWMALIDRLAPTAESVRSVGGGPTVSVVLPVFNGANAIQSAIDSVLNQDHQDFELIVVDDGSTDETAQLLANYVDDDRVRVIRNSRNRGLVASLNRGVEASRGSLIARLDHDDRCRTSRLRHQVDIFRTHPDTVLCASAFDRIDATGTFVRRSIPAQAHAALAIKLFASNNLCHSSVMFRKSAFLEAGGYDESWFPIEDYELWTRLLQRGRYRGLASVEVEYADSPAGISQRLNRIQGELRSTLVARMSDAAGLDNVDPWATRPAGDIQKVRQIGRIRNATVASLRRRRISVRDASLEARRMSLALLAHRSRLVRHLIVGAAAPRTALFGLLEQLASALRRPSTERDEP